MSTRSYIGKLLPGGSITGIYCHHDGYPEGVGVTLRDHYTDPAKVDALLALGSISSLGAEIGEKHEFATRSDEVEDVVDAYHRDRGEDLAPPKVYKDISDLRANVSSDMGAEYAYVFTRGEWVALKLDGMTGEFVALGNVTSRW
jgi:hypothetical protein